MPDLLGATNPVPGHDRGVVNRNVQLPVDNDRIQNVVDPSRVSRPDRRTDQQDNNLQGQNKIRYDSNFQVFLKRLRETPDMAESLRTILTDRDAVFSGIHEGTAQELAELIEFLKLDESQLFKFLLGQIKYGTQFGGALFTLLRNAYNRADSDTVRADILRFLKSYADFFSTDHITGNILRDLNGMAGAMPGSWAEQLRALTEQLNQLMQAGNRKDALLLLQRQIFPFMSQYVTRSHDMGLARELLSMLALNVSRYENGSVENMLEGFHQLKGYATLKNQLSQIDDRSLLLLLERGRIDQDSPAARFADHLAQAANRAIHGSGTAETQQAFQEIIRAMLINESVYMPLNHYLLPLQMNGKLMFSELWVDPDAEDDQKEERGRGERTIKCLFKMDVESLGLIDVVLISRGTDVDMQVSCSGQALQFSEKIEQGIDEILRRNELTPVRVAVRRMDRPAALTDVFPQIFERKDSMNVKV